MHDCRLQTMHDYAILHTASCSCIICATLGSPQMHIYYYLSSATACSRLLQLSCPTLSIKKWDSNFLAILHTDRQTNACENINSLVKVIMTKFFGWLIALCQTIIMGCLDVKLHMNLMKKSLLLSILSLLANRDSPCLFLFSSLKMLLIS